MLSVVPRLPSSLLPLAALMATPAVLYDLETMTEAVADLRADLKPLPHPTLCFAVKANRSPEVLKHLAQLGVGADVATRVELEAAKQAGLSPIYATSPGSSLEDWREFLRQGVLPDLNSLSQLAQWAEHFELGKRVGLRIRLPLPDDRYDVTPFGRWSRFGIDADDQHLHALLHTHQLEVVQLHAHAGELVTMEQVDLVIETMLTCLELFPRAEVVNLGGGFGPLYHDNAFASKAWYSVGEALKRWSTLNQRSPRVVVEPGMVLTSQAGFLVTTVVAVDAHPSGRRLAVLDASAWNLMPWAAPHVLAQDPIREGAKIPYDLAGCTCYEDDYFRRNELLPPLEVGDRLILSAAGAYVCSMAREAHGLPRPAEWVIRDARPEPVSAYR